MIRGIDHEAEHRKLWRFLAEHPTMGKGDYFAAEGIGWLERPMFDCYACEATIPYGMEGVANNCAACPLGGPRIVGCFNGDGLYNLWGRAVDPETRATIAKRIAELPWDVPVAFKIDKRIAEKMKEKAHGKSEDDRSV